MSKLANSLELPEGLSEFSAMNISFKAAPISRQVKFLTCFAVFILLGAFGILAVNGLDGRPRGVFIFPGVLVAVALLWAVSTILKSYELVPGALIVVRLSGRKTIPLDATTTIIFDPLAFKKSWRIIGNGGFFSFTGLFRNATLGNFSAFVSDPAKSVVIKTARKTFVISPAEPEKFVAQFQSQTPSPAHA